MTIATLYNQWRAAQPLDEILQRRIDQSFMIDFNYNSNHLEGNTLTYGQTKLLLLFGKVQGDGLMRDFEEMKAHNVGLKMMKTEALDRQRPLSESFIRELNRTILAGDFYKVSRDGSYKYKIHTGVYKTRPNSVITPAGELFDYASPEETPALMAELVAWYNDEEKKGELSPIELAALFHYRYIRIHPFEDGNGRIARLLINYILYRHGYPMIVILSSDRDNYLNVLGKCDSVTGREPYKGANATLEQIKIFLDYILNYVEKKLIYINDLLEGKVRDITETVKIDDVPEISADNQKNKNRPSRNVPDDVPEKRQQIIVGFIKANNKVSMLEIANLLKVNHKTIKRDIKALKEKGKLERIGGDRGGYWKIN